MTSAVLSPCGLYRYRLDRNIASTGLVYAFIGVNPSTADATTDDATVKKWIGFSELWGASRFIVGNVWPLRSKDVVRLSTYKRNKEIESENLRHILEIAAEADVVVPCWGDRHKLPSHLRKELDEMILVLLRTGKPVMHLGLTAAGDPRHPSRLAYATPLQPWVKSTAGK